MNAADKNRYDTLIFSLSQKTKKLHFEWEQITGLVTLLEYLDEVMSAVGRKNK